MATSMFEVCRPLADSQTPAQVAAVLCWPQDGGSEWPPQPRRLWHRAGHPYHHGDTAESPERRCGGGWSRTVKVRRLLLCVRAPSCSSFNDSLAAAAARVVAGWCVNGAIAFVSSDASCLLCRPAEAPLGWTSFVARCTLRYALLYADCSAAIYTQAIYNKRVAAGGLLTTRHCLAFAPDSRNSKKSFPGFEKIVRESRPVELNYNPNHDRGFCFSCFDECIVNVKVYICRPVWNLRGW